MADKETYSDADVRAFVEDGKQQMNSERVAIVSDIKGQAEVFNNPDVEVSYQLAKLRLLLFDRLK